MREAAELAESGGGFLEFDAGESVGVGAVGPDAKPVEKGFPDQMRRIAGHRADAEIDARLAEIDRLQLRMRIRRVQDARVAETFEIVNADIIGAAGETRQAA